jgi:hypothetical protein
MKRLLRLARLWITVLVGPRSGHIVWMAFFAALETGETTVWQGEKPNRRSQPINGSGYLDRRCQSALGQGIIKGQEVIEQL